MVIRIIIDRRRSQVGGFAAEIVDSLPEKQSLPSFLVVFVVVPIIYAFPASFMVLVSEYCIAAAIILII